jgi:hypothetical protein
VAERWILSVIEVRRVNERIIVVRLMIGNGILNLVSVYAPQVGRTMEEKEEFYVLLGKTLAELGTGERLMICGDMNGHVGEGVDGFEGIHGGKGFGVRNLEGEMLLEFADSREMIIANTFFQKNDAKKITYKSGDNSTVIDYMMVRKCDRGIVRDVKVIASEECIPQHRLLVGIVELREQVKKRKTVYVSKCRIWRLKQIDMRKSFYEQIKTGAQGRSTEGDVETVWKELKNCLLEAADNVCGKTKGPARHKETWWWNEDTEAAVAEKREKFLAWQKSQGENDKAAYKHAKKTAQRVIAKAQSDERQKFGEMLESEDGKGNLFKVAKQMVKENKDVVGVGCVKDNDGKIVVEETEVKEVWRKYFEKLMNEEFDWNRDSLDSVDAVSGPAELLSVGEIKVAIAKAKSNKAAGPSGVVTEMLKVSEEVGVQWVTDVCNAVVRDGKVPTDWKKSWMVNVYKGKGNALECGSYRGIKLLDHVMKVLERVIEVRVRNRAGIDDMQFGFRPGRGTTDAIFVVRQIQEKYLAKQRDLWMAFVDLEKAFDRVPRDVVWWALRHAGVEEWIVIVIKAMYEDATTAVKMKSGESQEFEVKVGVHQGSVLSPLLFIIVMQALSNNFREGLPWELLYADDLALLADSEEKLQEKIELWRRGMEEKGLRVNMGKTKVMKCQVMRGRTVAIGKFPCGVCRTGVRGNSIQCKKCEKWVHKKCSGVKSKLVVDDDFECSRCRGDVKELDEKRHLLLRQGDKLECVDTFCYLGDTLGRGGGVEDAVRTRVRCAWAKFRELSPLLTVRGVPLRLKGKIYKACVQSVLIYGSETWATKVEDMQKLERTERQMMRWMCGVSLKDRKSSEELMEWLGIDSVSNVVTRGRLRWFGHVERKSGDDWVSACREIVVDGVRKKGRGKKTWMESVMDDMKRCGLKREQAQDRAMWKRGIAGNRLTRTGADI